MRLIGFAMLLVAGFILTALDAEAQTAGKASRIGVLLSNSQASHLSHVEGFRQGLREGGYVEGQNILLDYRYGDGRVDRLASLAAELVGLRVDVIVTSGTPATRAAQQATRTIPVVMTLVGDPIAGGFISSLPKPGRNITGLTLISPDLSGKRLELLKEALPNVSRMALLIDPAPSRQGVLRQTRIAAETLGVNLVPLEVQDSNPDLEGAFRTAMSERVGALLVAPGPAIELYRKRIVDLAAKSRLPTMYGNREFVDLGGLMSYAPSYPDLFRRAATYVDKILKGAKPAELPVEQPTKFELVINLKTAKALGLMIPQSILLRADQVIE